MWSDRWMEEEWRCCEGEGVVRFDQLISKNKKCWWRGGNILSHSEKEISSKVANQSKSQLHITSWETHHPPQRTRSSQPPWTRCFWGRRLRTGTTPKPMSSTDPSLVSQVQRRAKQQQKRRSHNLLDANFNFFFSALPPSIPNSQIRSWKRSSLSVHSTWLMHAASCSVAPSRRTRLMSPDLPPKPPQLPSWPRTQRTTTTLTLSQTTRMTCAVTPRTGRPRTITACWALARSAGVPPVE